VVRAVGIAAVLVVPAMMASGLALTIGAPSGDG